MCMCSVDYAVSEMCEEISICCGAFFTLERERDGGSGGRVLQIGHLVNANLLML